MRHLPVESYPPAPRAVVEMPLLLISRTFGLMVAIFLSSCADQARYSNGDRVKEIANPPMVYGKVASVKPAQPTGWRDVRVLFEAEGEKRELHQILPPGKAEYLREGKSALVFHPKGRPERATLDKPVDPGKPPASPAQAGMKFGSTMIFAPLLALMLLSLFSHAKLKNGAAVAGEIVERKPLIGPLSRIRAEGGGKRASALQWRGDLKTGDPCVLLVDRRGRAMIAESIWAWKLADPVTASIRVEKEATAR